MNDHEENTKNHKHDIDNLSKKYEELELICKQKESDLENITQKYNTLKIINHKDAQKCKDLDKSL